MSSNGLKRSRLSNDNDEDSIDDKPPTKKQIKTNDIIHNYLSTSDNYINDLLQQINDLKQTVHNLKEQQNEIIKKEDITPLLTIKYQNESVANKYNKNILSFLKETFHNRDNIKYNISSEFNVIKVFEKEKVGNQIEVIEINDDTFGQNVDKIILSDTECPTVDDMICLDTTPNILNDNTDVQYNILSKPDNQKNSASNNFSCFNCGDKSGVKHNLKDCPFPKNWERINAARNKFKIQMNQNQRYHVSDNNDISRFASLKPGGELSKELRHALGLHSKEIPMHIYKMRLLGYPPGWYQELVTQNESLSMFTDTGSQNDSTMDKNGTIDISSNVVIKDSMIIEYPGFNVPLKKDLKDEYWKYKVPPIQECQFKHNFIFYLNQSRNSSLVNTNEDSIIIDTNKDNSVIDITTDNTDDDDNDERLSVEMEIIPNTDELIPIDLTDTNSQDDELPSSNKTNDDNRIDNENGDSNHLSSDGIDNNDNNTSSSTFSNNDNKSTPTLARTPLLTKVSTYKTLPEMEKFGKDMGPLIMFENLSDSVGTYNKMKGLLNKVRTTLKNIQPFPS